MSAAEIIRQHLEALPEGARFPWHVSHFEDCGDVIAMDGKRPQREVCVSDIRAAGEYIALLASPHVAEALAELLEAIQRFELDVPMFVWHAWSALEAAISREGRST